MAELLSQLPAGTVSDLVLHPPGAVLAFSDSLEGGDAGPAVVALSQLAKLADRQRSLVNGVKVPRGCALPFSLLEHSLRAAGDHTYQAFQEMLASLEVADASDLPMMCKRLEELICGLEPPALAITNLTRALKDDDDDADAACYASLTPSSNVSAGVVGVGDDDLYRTIPLVNVTDPEAFRTAITLVRETLNFHKRRTWL
jgi:hypothetical protein